MRKKTEAKFTMCSMTLIAKEMTTATSQLTSAAYQDVYFPGKAKRETQLQQLHMNWVVVTDDNGKRRLQMDWRAGQDN